MYITTNKAHCCNCNETIESKHKYDFVTCKCGSLSVDGGKQYVRRVFKNSQDFIELTEYSNEPVWTTAEGVTRPISELFDDHILNIIKDGYNNPDIFKEADKRKLKYKKPEEKLLAYWINF